MPTDREKNRFSARAKRYANVGTKVGGVAARMAGQRLFGSKPDDRAGNALALASALGGLKGPIMKVAQLLATIPDAVPAEYANELMKLMAGYVRSLPDSAQQHPRFPCLTTARTPHGACLQDPSTKPDYKREVDKQLAKIQAQVTELRDVVATLTAEDNLADASLLEARAGAPNGRTEEHGKSVGKEQGTAHRRVRTRRLLRENPPSAA